MRVRFLVVLLAGFVLAAVFATPMAAGHRCPWGPYGNNTNSSYWINPVEQWYLEWDHSVCNWSSEDALPMSCGYTPIVEVGEPVLNGFRQGAYYYICDLFGGSHTYYEAGSVTTPEERCENVPPVFVLGQPVPGTGQPHCTPDSVTIHEERYVDSPDAVQSQGLLYVYPNLFGPGYTASWVDILEDGAGTCNGALDTLLGPPDPTGPTASVAACN